MRILVAGATGTLGRPVVRRLVAAGHEVVGTTRAPSRSATIEALGASAEVMEALDPASVVRAVEGARPDVIVHLLTALPPAGPLRPRDLVATNRLREEGTRNLLDAAKRGKVEGVIAESFVGIYGLGDGAVVTEETVGTRIPRSLAPSHRALVSLEEQIADAGGISLRFGFLYGPEVPSTSDAADQLRRRKTMRPSRLASSCWSSPGGSVCRYPDECPSGSPNSPFRWPLRWRSMPVCGSRTPRFATRPDGCRHTGHIARALPRSPTQRTDRLLLPSPGQGKRPGTAPVTPQICGFRSQFGARPAA